MQARFQFAASNIQPILNTRAVKKTPKSFADLIKTGVPSSVAEADADDNDEDDGNSNFQPVNTTTQIASQLMIWKDDVTQLLEMVQGHIVRCQKIEDHEVHSHKPKETQLDFRRKRINDFLLSMKADLRALTRFAAHITKNRHNHDESVTAMYDSHGVSMINSPYLANTESFWRQRTEELEKKLAKLKPVEPTIKKTDEDGGGEGGGEEQKKEQEQTQFQKYESKQNVITASQFADLFEQRQQLIILIIDEVLSIQAEFESEYGGEDDAVEKMLINSQDQREISGAVRQYLRIVENFTEMVDANNDTPATIAKSWKINRDTEKLTRACNLIDAKSNHVEQETIRMKRNRNEFVNSEIQRSLLTRWAATLDELEYAGKTLNSREELLDEELDKWDEEGEKLNRKVVSLQLQEREATSKHEEVLKEIRPDMERLENQARTHQRILENLLLDVNLTTGLFKKRETKVAAIAAKISKTRSTKSQIEIARKANTVEYATLAIDSKRNSKILEVALQCNETAKKEFLANRTLRKEYQEEIEENGREIEGLARETGDLKKKIDRMKVGLEEQERKNRYLGTFETKLKGDLVKKTAEVNEVLGQFNDENHQKLRDIQAEVKRVLLENKEKKEGLKKGKKRVDELEARAVSTNLADVLDEFK